MFVILDDEYDYIYSKQSWDGTYNMDWLSLDGLEIVGKPTVFETKQDALDEIEIIKEKFKESGDDEPVLKAIKLFIKTSYRIEDEY